MFSPKIGEYRKNILKVTPDSVEFPHLGEKNILFNRTNFGQFFVEPSIIVTNLELILKHLSRYSFLVILQMSCHGDRVQLKLARMKEKRK
jgi:hypothetical protein